MALSATQKKFIPLYLKLGSIKATCEKLKIAENTYQNWKDDTEFMAELKKQEDELYNSSIKELQNLFPEAISTFKTLLKSENETIQFRTASAIVDNIVKLVENKDIRVLILCNGLLFQYSFSKIFKSLYWAFKYSGGQNSPQ